MSFRFICGGDTFLEVPEDAEAFALRSAEGSEMYNEMVREVRSINSAAANQGGYLIAPRYTGQLLKGMESFGGLRDSRARDWRTGHGASINLATNNDTQMAHVVGFRQETPEEDLEFGLLTSNTLLGSSGVVLVDIDVLQDATEPGQLVLIIPDGCRLEGLSTASAVDLGDAFDAYRREQVALAQHGLADSAGTLTEALARLDAAQQATPWGAFPPLLRVFLVSGSSGVRVFLVLLVAVGVTLFGMKKLTAKEIGGQLDEQFAIFGDKHSRIMTWLYTMTFGSWGAGYPTNWGRPGHPLGHHHHDRRDPRCRLFRLTGEPIAAAGAVLHDSRHISLPSIFICSSMPPG